MQIEFMYTRYQTARGARPDAEVNGKFYLIKNVSEMRLTDQIKILAYFAQLRAKRLIVQLPSQATVHSSLRDFVHSHPELVKIERV
jgi:hypothetical protein